MRSVLSVGSCRVGDPLLDLRDRGLLTLPAGLARRYGYTHSTPQHEQLLGVLRGTVVVPPLVATYAADHPDRWADDPAAHERHDLLATADVLVVEICSRKVFTLGDWQIKDGVAITALIRRSERLGAWWRSVVREGRPDPELVEELVPTVSEAEAQVLRTAGFRRQDEDEVVRDMRAIAGAFAGEVVWVPHVTALGDGDQPIAEREHLREVVRRGVAEAGGRWHDPNVLIAALGPDRALQDGNHYRGDVLPAVGGALWETISA